ncbi:MAG: CRISPR-associated endonuclease Cas2 [Oscillospiraceae bacterium]|nr:CRISPR-associated endonuclease Cas2 [Oscillospiraceae bacterium]
MNILLTYDVNTSASDGAKRLRKVAKQCEKYGLRVQDSVFELDVDMAQLTVLTNELEKIIDEKKDSIRIYHLGKNLKEHITVIGRKQLIENTEAFIL